MKKYVHALCKVSLLLQKYAGNRLGAQCVLRDLERIVSSLTSRGEGQGNYFVRSLWRSVPSDELLLATLNAYVKLVIGTDDSSPDL